MSRRCSQPSQFIAAGRAATSNAAIRTSMSPPSTDATRSTTSIRWFMSGLPGLSPCERMVSMGLGGEGQGFRQVAAGQFSIGPIVDTLKLVSCHPAIVVMTRVSNPLKSAGFFRVFEPRAALGFESHYPQHRGQSSDLRKLEPQIPHLMRPAATSAPDASKTHGAFGQGACCRALTASQRFSEARSEGAERPC